MTSPRGACAPCRPLSAFIDERLKRAFFRAKTLEIRRAGILSDGPLITQCNIECVTQSDLIGRRLSICTVGACLVTFCALPVQGGLDRAANGPSGAWSVAVTVVPGRRARADQSAD